jgi:signal transduction histidine kinase
MPQTSLEQKKRQEVKMLRTKLKEEHTKFLQLSRKVIADKKYAQQFIHVLLEQQEEDRKEISRDLHDEIAQLLTGINFELAILSKEAAKSIKVVRDRIVTTQQLVVQSVEIIHRFAQQLRPMILDDLGLLPALTSYIKEFTTKTNIHVDLTTFARMSQLSEKNKTVLFRVAQEALTNIARHSKAQNASVIIRKIKNSIHMEIHDNGISFEVNKLRALNKNKRIGLLGMEERVIMAKGQFKITSSPTKGTSIIVSIPIVA